MPALYNASHSLGCQTGGAPTAAKFRQIAEWLDLADRGFQVLAELQQDTVPPGTGVQDDLRRWADDMDIDEADVLLDGTARVCHEANRALQIVQNDPSIPVALSWDMTSEEQRQSVRRGVLGILDGNTPEESHASWLSLKIKTGWTWGPVKDEGTRRHPLLVPYSDLPESGKVKDALFSAIIHALMDVN